MALEDLIGLKGLERYKHAELARRFLKNETDSIHIESAINALCDSMGVDAKKAVRIAAKHGGMEDVIKTYSADYQNALGSLKVEELLTYYTGDIESYLNPGETSKVRAEFEKFSGEKFVDISDKLKKSKFIIEGKDKGLYNFSGEEIENAKKTQKKYQNLTLIISILEEIKFESLRPNIVKQTYKEALKEISDKLYLAN